MTIKRLNPSAPTFSLGGYATTSSSGTPASSPSAYELGVYPLNHAGNDHNDDPIIPGPPSNTPEIVNSTRKVATSLGDGWLTAFSPVASFPTVVPAPTASVGVTATTKFGTPTRPAFMRSGTDVKTPNSSVSSAAPDILPSEEARKDALSYNLIHKTDRAKLALKHLDISSSSSYTNDNKSPKFDPLGPFAEEEEYDPIMVDWTKSKGSPGTASMSSMRPYYQDASPVPRRTVSSPGLARVYYGRDLRQVESTSLESLYPAVTSDIGEGRNVYLPELASTATEDVLRKIGQSFGRVVSVKVEHNGNTAPESADMLPDGARRSSRTYAFVMFDSSLAATKFMAYMKEHNITCQHGKETPHLKQKALEDPHSSNLYVAEIPLDITEAEMQDLFFPGVISSLRFLTDDQGNRRGTAMVRLQSRAQAEEAIRRLDLKVQISGCSKPLQVRIADSENQKQLKKHSNNPRPMDPTPTSPSANRTLRATRFPVSFADEIDDLALREHMKACEEELRRRQSTDFLRRRPSDVSHRTPSLHKPSPTSPTFDCSYRRPSTDGVEMLPSMLRSTTISRQPLFDASMGRDYETPTKQVSRRASVDVTNTRSAYTNQSFINNNMTARWESNDSQRGLSGSSSASSLGSVNSVKDRSSRHCDVSNIPDVFGDGRGSF